uniref:CREST protein n=1 Tax=Steinernema glaseri TaxID=37863 RepID=A0A1I7Z6E4_9BILA
MPEQKCASSATQPNGQQALWPVQISSSISGAPMFTVSQGQRVVSTTTSVAASTASQMQPLQTVQSNSTAEMVPSYSVTSSSSDLPQVHFINDQDATSDMCTSASSTTNGSFYGS